MQNQLNAVMKEVHSVQDMLEATQEKCNSIFELINAYAERDTCAHTTDNRPQHPRLPTPKHLKIGSSLLRDLKEEDMVNTTVIAKSGGTSEDFIRILNAKIKKGERYSSVDILGGGNAISPKNPKKKAKSPQEAAAEMKEVITLAKKLGPEVRVIELPPRPLNPEIQANIVDLNGELEKLCGELDVPFVKTNGMFYTANGNINMALLHEDNIHLSPHGSMAIVELTQIELKSTDVSGVSPFAAYNRKIVNEPHGKSDSDRKAQKKPETRPRGQNRAPKQPASPRQGTYPAQAMGGQTQYVGHAKQGASYRAPGPHMQNTQERNHANQGNSHRAPGPYMHNTQERNHDRAQSTRAKSHSNGNHNAGNQRNPPSHARPRKSRPGSKQNNTRPERSPPAAGTDTPYPCALCNNFGHSPIVCRARFQHCYNCQEMGHFGKVCPR